MPVEKKIKSHLSELIEISPTGYAISLHIKYTTPKFMFQTYPQEWLQHYSEKGLIMQDPTVLWGFENLGYVRWSELTDINIDDPNSTLSQSRDFGINYGFTWAIETSGSRSIAGFSRYDREFTNSEITKIEQITTDLHELTHEESDLPEDFQQFLKKLSVQYTQKS